MGRTLIIADIHGCCQALQELLALVQPDPSQDRLVFLGDYVDRGPDSAAVVAYVLALRRQFPSLVALRGNHEVALQEFLAGRNRDFYLEIGGRQTLASYGCVAPYDSRCGALIPAAHQAFFENLLPYWQDDSFIYVHAALQPGMHLSQQTPEWLYWGGDGRGFIDQRYDFGKPVIFGHTVFEVPLVTPDKIGIDSGAVYGGYLNCLVVPDMEFVRVPSPKFWPPQ